MERLKQLGVFLTRHRSALKVVGGLITLAGGGGLLFSESFRNNVLYFGGKHHHEHQTVINDHRTYTTLHQHNDSATSKPKDAHNADHNGDTTLALDIEAEKRLKLEHRNRIRERTKIGGDTQTIQMTPD